MEQRGLDVPVNTANIKLRLAFSLGEENQVSFLVDFVNESESVEEVLFSENIDEAASVVS